MNNKGFTLVELLATLVILALVVGLSLSAFNFNFGNAKKKTEEVFVDTLRDAVDTYLSSEFGNLKSYDECPNPLEKKYNTNVRVYKVKDNDDSSITFKDIIDSDYKPITESDLINPANEKKCSTDAVINVYRDEDYIYYYSIAKSNLDCLENVNEEDGYSSIITNLPKGYSCE